MSRFIGILILSCCHIIELGYIFQAINRKIQLHKSSVMEQLHTYYFLILIFFPPIMHICLSNILRIACVGASQTENLAKEIEVLKVAEVLFLFSKVVREYSILCHSLLMHWLHLQCKSVKKKRTCLFFVFFPLFLHQRKKDDNY